MANAIAPYRHERMLAANKTNGWGRGSIGEDLIIFNAKVGTFVLHVVNQNEKGEVTWDQILRAEQGGGVFLPITKDGKFGLQKRIRPQTRDQEAYAKYFAEQAQKGNFGGVVDLSLLGRTSYECCRGFANIGESGHNAASREGREESQSMIISDYDLGYQCDNTAFSPHLTATHWGKIDPSKKPLDKPDPNEKLLGPVEYFDYNGLRDLRVKGELYCSYTLSAIGMFLIDLNSMAMLNR